MSPSLFLAVLYHIRRHEEVLGVGLRFSLYDIGRDRGLNLGGRRFVLQLLFFPAFKRESIIFGPSRKVCIPKAEDIWNRHKILNDVA